MIKYIHILTPLTVMIIIAALFIKVFVISIPPYSAVQIYPYKNGELTFIENNTPQTKIIIQQHHDYQVYNTSVNFVLTGVYAYAPKLSKGQTLQNNISFSVLLPFENIAESDTSLFFNMIRAHAFVALQQASKEINNDFYGPNPQAASKYIPYPAVFKYYLNDLENSRLKNVYFTDVSMSKILYENKLSAKDISKFMISCLNFLILTNGYSIPSEYSLVGISKKVQRLNQSIYEQFVEFKNLQTKKGELIES